MIVHHDVTRRLDAVVEEEPMHVEGNNMTVVVVDDDTHHRGAADGNAHEEGVEVGQGIENFHNDVDNDDPRESNRHHHYYYNAFDGIEDLHLLALVDPNASMRMVKNHVPYCLLFVVVLSDFRWYDIVCTIPLLACFSFLLVTTL